MPVLPRNLFVLGARVLSARTARRLKRPDTAIREQDAAFEGLVRQIVDTQFGKDNGITRNLDYPLFHARVPIRAYEGFSPYIERMKRGEANVLWPGQCSFYAVSSGTTAGPSKWLPVTEEMLAHFRKAGLASLLFYSARVGRASVFRGRHLFLGGSTTLAPIEEAKPFVAFGGDLSGITALNLPRWAERHLYEPGTDLAQMSDWPKKIEAIVARTLHRDITLLAGIPSWLLILAEALRNAATHGKARPANLQAIWRNFECLVHGGVPIQPFQDELRRAMGSTVNFHEVYPASEGFIAAQDADQAAGLRLMSDAGLFFEFLPLRDFDDSLPTGLGSKAIPLAEVKPDEDYVLLLTTPAGLCRYVIGDVVRFVSVEPPRLIYVGRTKLQLSAFGEHVIEKELTDSVVAVCTRHGWSIANFHVAPIFANTLTGHTRGRHEWWIELRSGTVETPTGPILAAGLDTELMTRNDDYAGKRNGGGMEPPIVRLVMPGFFEHWMRYHGKWGGQNKMPRCRSDRQIADELTQVACFNSE